MEGAVVVTGSNRVKRGGSWNNNANNVRVANRNNNSPGNTNNNIGFRPLSTGALFPELRRSTERGGVMSVCPRRPSCTESGVLHGRRGPGAGKVLRSSTSLADRGFVKEKQPPRDW